MVVAESFSMASQKPRTRGARRKGTPHSTLEVELTKVERQFGLQACGQCVGPSETVTLALEELQVTRGPGRCQSVSHALGLCRWDDRVLGSLEQQDGASH